MSGFNLSKDQFSTKFKGAVYANAGTGKTRSIITAPSPLLINIENRLTGLTDSFKELESGHSVFTIDVASAPSGKTPYDVMMDGLYGASGIIPILKTEKAANKYKTVFLDSLTVVGSLITEHFPKPRNEFEYWPSMQRQFYKIVNDINNLPYNVVHILQCKIGKKKGYDEKGKEFSFDYYEPVAFNNKVSQDLRFNLENIFYMYTKGFGSSKQVIMLTDESDVAYARCTKKGALNPSETFNLSKDSPVGWKQIFDKMSKYDQSKLG